MNLYQYAPNPTGWVDPFGLASGKAGCVCGTNGELKGIDLDGDGKLSEEESVLYFRVQGGTMPNASRELLTPIENGKIKVKKDTNLNISTGDIKHAEYFLKEKRPGGEIVSFEVPKSLDNLVKETAIPQKNYKKNPLNQGGTAPKIVDPTTPGTSYEFPPDWADLFEEYGKNAKVHK
jgi:hypothetical protein